MNSRTSGEAVVRLGCSLLTAIALASCAACEDGEGPGPAGGGGSGGAPGSCATDPCLCTPVDCCLCPGQVACCEPACHEDPDRSCLVAVDCGAPGDFACLHGCCVELCHGAEDCALRPGCAGSAPGCVCDEGLCTTGSCSADGECPEESPVCAAGACEPAPDPAAATSCRLHPGAGVLPDGATVQLVGRTYSAQGWLAAPASAFLFSATGMATVSESGLVTAVGEGRATVVATIGNARCEATFVTLAELALGDVRVVVTDEATGLPVEGATVLFGAAPPLSGPTDTAGRVVFAGAAGGGPVSISVFRSDYGHVTVVGTGATDVALALRRAAPAGLAGGFAGVPRPQLLFDDNNLHLVAGGTALAGGVTELSGERLLGPRFETVINVGGEQRVQMPAGISFGLGSQWFKEELLGLGAPGSCSDAAATEAGTCGTASAWAIGGGMPLSDLPIDQLASGVFSYSLLLAVMLPRLQEPYSAFVREVEYDLVPTVPGPRGEELPDPRGLTRLELDLARRAALRCEVVVPGLPRRGATDLDGALVVGGALAPGRGFVPLGLGGGPDVADPANELPDGWIDDPAGGSTGVVRLRLAPAHGGLEGSRYAVVALAVNLAGEDSTGSCTAAARAGCHASSALVALRDALPFGETVSFARHFLRAPDDASYDPGARRFDAGSAAAGATLYRITFRDEAGGEWTVFSDRAAWTLPAPPAWIDDRSLKANGARTDLRVQALVLDRPLDELFTFGGPGLAALDEATAFSTTELPR